MSGRGRKSLKTFDFKVALAICHVPSANELQTGYFTFALSSIKSGVKKTLAPSRVLLRLRLTLSRAHELVAEDRKQNSGHDQSLYNIN